MGELTPNRDHPLNKQKNHTSLADLSVGALTTGFACGDFSPVEATRACLSRIKEFNGEVNAFCFVDADGALASAAKAEKRWRNKAPLSAIDGVPTTSKDTTKVTGWTSTVGSHVFAMDAPAEEDSSCVARLKEAGAVLLGLTTSPEIGWKGVTDSPRHGITRNPWDTSKTPGGSSGGAVVAAALGMGCLHVGTDAGGSIRIPAAFTGVFGHKPSFGRVPNYPPSPFSSLSHAGPLTRNVRDAAYMMDIITGRDPRDWTALPATTIDYTADLNSELRGKKIAFCPVFGGSKSDRDVADNVQQAVLVLEGLGAHVEEVTFDLTGVTDILETIWHGAVAWRLDTLSEAQLAQLDPGLLAFHNRPHDKSRLNFIDAAHQRLEFGVRANTFFERYDLMVTPTLPITAFAAGQNVPDGGSYQSWWDWATFCYPFNLTGQPACSVPCGFSDADMPVGLQIIGRQYEDASVLQAAAAYENIAPAAMPPTPMDKTSARSRRTPTDATPVPVK